MNRARNSGPRDCGLWTIEFTAARHNGGDAIIICHKASRVWTLSSAWMHQITFRKKTAIKLKSILICGPCHARVITAKTFLQMCCTSCPECHAHGLSLLGNYYPASVDCIPSKQRQRERTRKTGDHFAGWDFSVDTRVQRSICCGFSSKEVDHAWFPMNSVEFIQA